MRFEFPLHRAPPLVSRRAMRVGRPRREHRSRPWNTCPRARPRTGSACLPS